MLFENSFCVQLLFFIVFCADHMVFLSVYENSSEWKTMNGAEMGGETKDSKGTERKKNYYKKLYSLSFVLFIFCAALKISCETTENQKEKNKKRKE